MFATQNTKIFTRKWKLILKCFAHIHCVDQIFWQLSRQLELANFKINAPYSGHLTSYRMYGFLPKPSTAKDELRDYVRDSCFRRKVQKFRVMCPYRMLAIRFLIYPAAYRGGWARSSPRRARARWQQPPFQAVKAGSMARYLAKTSLKMNNFAWWLYACYRKLVDMCI